MTTTGLLGWSRWQRWPASVHRDFLGTRWWVGVELGPDGDGRDDRCFVELDLAPVTETGWSRIGVQSLAQAEIGWLDWEHLGFLSHLEPVRLGVPLRATVVEQTLPQWWRDPQPLHLELGVVDAIWTCIDDLPPGPDVSDRVLLDERGEIECWMERARPCWEPTEDPEALPWLTGRPWL